MKGHGMRFPIKLKDNKGIALMAVIFAMLLLGILGITMTSFVSNDLENSIDNFQSGQAFYVAEGGLQYVQMREFFGDSDLSDNTSPTDAPFGANSISLNPGQFWVEYSNQSANSIDVKVTAKAGQAVRVIYQTVRNDGPGGRYVTMAGGNINMNNSTGQIYGDVALKGISHIDDPPINVYGNIIEDPNLVLPTLDYSYYKTRAQTGTTTSGNLTITNDSECQGDNYVTGWVKINSGVTCTGLLYADGNININASNVIMNGTFITEASFNADHNTGLQFNAQPVSPGSTNYMPAIASQNLFSIKDSDSMQVNGVCWNPGNLDFGGSDNLQYRGSFVAGGNVIINNTDNVTITFDADLTVGIPGMSGGGAGVTVGSLVLSEWRTY
jgi:Tfp pilus assembly protein PilX